MSEWFFINHVLWLVDTKQIDRLRARQRKLLTTHSPYT
jgi:hypothetical protein